jgi:hypothetical protein
LMLRLGREAGLPAPDSYWCTWIENDAAAHGIIVRLFLETQLEELSLGSVLLRQSDQAYDAESKWMHTLPRVRQVLTGLGAPTLVADFARLLAFDGWVGNADRHQENWGVITSVAKMPRLAPLFDPASCLGAELQEGNRYLSGVPTPKMFEQIHGAMWKWVGDGTAAVPLQAVIEQLGSWPEWKSLASSWVAEFRSAMDNLERFLPTVPSSCLPDPRKRFALELLKARLSWLQGML